MKRLFSILAIAAMVSGCSKDDSKIVRVYNWGDYIDEEVINKALIDINIGN